MSTPIAWHASLPQRPNADPYEDESGLNSELFQPDAKITRGRRIAEDLPDTRRMDFDLSRSQYETWKSFFKTTLKGGFIPVTIIDPVTGDPLDLLIVDRPKIARQAVDVWTLTLMFEEL